MFHKLRNVTHKELIFLTENYPQTMISVESVNVYVYINEDKRLKFSSSTQK